MSVVVVTVSHQTPESDQITSCIAGDPSGSKQALSGGVSDSKSEK
jgi:hypothetical protein